MTYLYSDKSYTTVKTGHTDISYYIVYHSKANAVLAFYQTCSLLSLILVNR